MLALEFQSGLRLKRQGYGVPPTTVIQVAPTSTQVSGACKTILIMYKIKL